MQINEKEKLKYCIQLRFVISIQSFSAGYPKVPQGQYTTADGRLCNLNEARGRKRYRKTERKIDIAMLYLHFCTGDTIYTRISMLHPSCLWERTKSILTEPRQDSLHIYCVQVYVITLYKKCYTETMQGCLLIRDYRCNELYIYAMRH